MIASINHTRLDLTSEMERLAIVGGGISGMSAALTAVENGADPANIHIFEASERFGGKIKNAPIGNRMISAGAEFIDSEDAALLAICEKLKPYGVKLIPSTEQGTESFQRLDGTLMGGKDFCAAYAPIAKQIMRDRELKEKDPEAAKKFDNMSTEDYLNHLQKTVPANPDRTTTQWLWDTLTFKTNRVDPEIIEMAKRGYCHGEVGRNPSEVSASLFIGETSPSPNRFLYSDCGARVEGGMENVTIALKKHLEDKGVQFHDNAPVKAISREGGVNTLAFANDHPAVKCGKTIFSLPAYSLDKIEGLQALGMSDQAAQLVQNTQYCNLVKFTVRVKDGAKLPEANFFSSRGYEAWSPEPGLMTFLCHTDEMQKHGTPRKLMEFCTRDYAKTNRLNHDAAFEPIEPNNVVFNNPGRNFGCYTTAAPGQMVALQSFGEALDSLASNGVGISGTFIPFEGTVGFMNCGVESGKRSIAALSGGRSNFREQMLAHGLPSRAVAARQAPPALGA